MKSIFDRIDPVYLDHTKQNIECMAGTCEHTSHAHILPVYILGVLLVVSILYVNRRLCPE